MNAFDGLRLTIVGPLPPPAGGMANQTRQLAELLGVSGAKVAIVQTNPAYRPRWSARIPYVRAGIRLLQYLAALWRAAGKTELVHIMANSGWSWHLFAAPAICIAAMRRVPVVVNYRGGEAATFLRKSHRIVKRTMSKAAIVAVPSGYLRDVFAEFGVSTSVVPNIVDLNRFRPDSAHAPRAAHMLVARNLEPIYDNATAIRALALLRAEFPAARLTIAGTGPELASLRSLADELGIADAVCFSGRLDREQMAALYREVDVALNPSTVDNMPNSILEALASGVPVVSTDVGGVPYLVQHGTSALLVEPRDPQAMAAAVADLLHNPQKWSQLSAAGLKEAQRYSWSEVSKVLAEVYERAMRKPTVPLSSIDGGFSSHRSF